LGDSHTKGIAGGVQHRLEKSSEFIGIVKPAVNMEEIANTASSTARSLAKKDVCIVRGGTRDVAKNESENGLRQMNRLLSRLTHTNVVVINVPHRNDLMEWACVNNAVKDFNRKLRKHLRAYDDLKMIEVENLRELYTNLGLHLNGKGKESLANKIVKVTNDILNEK
jgi:lysophospholipase L1-like esterase